MNTRMNTTALLPSRLVAAGSAVPTRVLAS
jgi:hypothetical protein